MYLRFVQERSLREYSIIFTGILLELHAAREPYFISSDTLTVIRILKNFLPSCAFGLVKSVCDAVSLTLDFLSHCV